MEDVLKGKPGDRRLPVVVYLDDIAVFGDDQNQVMVDTLAVLERLAGAGFMINLKKSQIVESAAKVLGTIGTKVATGLHAPIKSKPYAMHQKTNCRR